MLKAHNGCSAMRIAVVFRGFHKRSKTHDGSAMPFDFRNTWHNVERCILAPLRARGTVVVYAATYKSDTATETEVKRLLQPKRALFQEPSPGYTQCDAICDGVRMVLDDSEERFDELWVLRFDLVYKMPIDAWQLERMHPHGVTVPFGNFDRMTGDALFALRGGWYIFAKFWQAARISKAKGFGVHLHRGPEIFEAAHLPWSTFVDGDYDSATFMKSKDCNNPMYVMAGRPYHFSDAPCPLSCDGTGENKN